MTWIVNSGGAPLVGAAADFSTTFPATENPLSQGGIWVNGGTNGANWQDVQTTPGLAFGSGFAGSTFQSTEFDDDLAHLGTSYRIFTPNQFSEGTVSRAVGYTPTSNHELELLLRFLITPNNARGYEILWAGTDGECNIVRWNGPLADSSNSNNGFAALLGSSGPLIGVPADGDVLTAKMIGTVITVYKNGVATAATYDTASDVTKWSSGQPGIGFWPRGAGNVTRASLGWKSFRAGNL